MKKIMMACGMSLVMVCASVGVSFAQEDEPELQFYTFNPMDIEGGVQGAQVVKVSAKKKTEFERLASLKRSFVPMLVESSASSALD